MYLSNQTRWQDIKARWQLRKEKKSLENKYAKLKKALACLDAFFGWIGANMHIGDIDGRLNHYKISMPISKTIIVRFGAAFGYLLQA